MTELSLSIQYGVPAPQLPRWRLRRWVQRALDAALNTAPAANGAGHSAIHAAALTLRFVDAEEGQELNSQFRARDYATNVLTFEYGIDPEGTLRGDIVLCLPVLEREAREQRKSLVDHAAHLTVHGVLHSLGHDHIDPGEAAAMEALETHILAKMGIADPYQEH